MSKQEEMLQWIEKGLGNNYIKLEILSPNEKQKYKEYLEKFWNVLASDNPDRNTNPFFIRTSFDFDEDGPLIRKVTVTDEQQIFIPVCTCSADKNHYPQVDLETEVRKAFPSGTTPELKVTIDGYPIIDKSEWNEFYVEPKEQFELNISEKAPLLGTKLFFIYPGNSIAKAAGFGVVIKNLPYREKPYWLYVRSKLPDGYTTVAYYKISVIDVP